MGTSSRKRYKVKLSNLHECSKQDVFEQVANHLILQNQRSTGNKHCLYLSSEGFQCAVGCMIPKKEYRKGMEGLSWHKLFGKYVKNTLPDDLYNFIDELQKIHDEESPYYWLEKLKYLGLRYDLDVNFLNTIRVVQ
jgi:hypothetical protein